MRHTIKIFFSALLLFAGLLPQAAQAQHYSPITNYFQEGFTTDYDEVNYLPGQSINFHLNKLVDEADLVTWNFIGHTSRTLITTTTGKNPSVSFTYSQGAESIDVECNVEYGVYKTRIFKPQHITIWDLHSTPDYTINLSLGTSDPRIASDGSGGHTVDFSGISGGSTVRLMGSITTQRLKWINVPDNKTNPIFVVINSTTVVHKQNILTLSGSSGTANIKIRGTSYLATFSTSLATTVANFVTTHGSAINSATGATVTNVGNTLQITDVSFEITNLTGNLGGTNAYDEAIRIDDGAPANGLWVWGQKATDGTRYFTVNGGGFSMFRATNASSHNNIRLTGIKVSAAQSAAFKAKLDNVSRYNTEAIDDLWIYDNEIDGPTNEGTYCGWEAAYGYRFDPTFNGGDYHHRLRNLKLFLNYVHDTGWDGIQCTGADTNTEIHSNLFVNNGRSGVLTQDFSITAAGGFSGQIYNNIFDRHIQVFANGDTWIYGNFIPGYVNASVNNAIFIRRYDNPMSLGPNGDSYYHSSPTGRLFIFNNVIAAIQDPVYILDGNDAGTGKIPLQSLRVFNNTLTWSGTAQESLGLRYSESGGTAADSILLNNYIAASVASIKITDQAGHDVHLDPLSPTFKISNVGLDLSLYVHSWNLRVGFTDMTGQSYPVRGYFWNAPIQRPFGFVAPLKNDESFQWFQTNQTSTFSDKVRLSDMYGAVIKRYAEIGGSAKPKYLMSVRPAAKTGNKIGIETFNTTSNN